MQIHQAKKQRVFKPGTFPATNGKMYSFSAADVREIRDSYNPAVYAAPLVIGHPKTDSPAYGKVRSLELAGEHLDAQPESVSAEFADWVNKGYWDKISIALFDRADPANPTPGKLHLRHVGFLGGVPPAVTGLPVASFRAGSEPIEFADWNGLSVASLFRRIKNWIIDKDGQEKADAVMPEYELEGLTLNAARKDEPSQAASFAAPNNEGETTMDPRELERRAQENARREQELAEREKNLRAAESQRRRDGIATRVKALVESGRLLPRDQEAAVAFAASIDAGLEIEFAAVNGGQAEKKPAGEWFLKLLEESPVRVDLGERSRPGADADAAVTFAAPSGYSVDAKQLELHNKALAYQAQHPNTTYDAAIAAVSR